MKIFKNRIILSCYTIMVLLGLVIPDSGFGGGEWSGEGILRPAGHEFHTRHAAEIAFSQMQSGTEAYWESAFAKSVPEIKLHPDSRDHFIADTEVCIDGEQVRSVVPGNRSGEFIAVPLEYQVQECQWWLVEHKEHTTPRRFRYLSQAERWADDSRNARGEPYCNDEDWIMVTKTPPTSYQVKFYADVRGEEELIEVGRFRFRLFQCNQLNQLALRRQINYQDFVSDDLNFHPEDWLVMAGGEFSGEGKRKRDR